MWFDEEERRQLEDNGQGSKPARFLKPRNAPREDIVEWARDSLGFVADAVQQQVLRTPSRRVILNCTRQWGKSTVTAAKAVHQAVTKPGSLTLVASPCARQSAEFVRKAEGFVSRLGITTKGDGSNEISVALPNGSRIVGLPGTEGTVRGFSAVSLLLVDEASRVDDDLYRAVRPMLAVSGGSLWMMSTPKGKRGFFWETWDQGGPEWERVKAPAHQCPRIPQSFLEEERKVMGDLYFEQEYGCSFSEGSVGLFDRDLIEAAFTDRFTALVL